MGAHGPRHGKQVRKNTTTKQRYAGWSREIERQRQSEEEEAAELINHIIRRGKENAGE